MRQTDEKQQMPDNGLIIGKFMPLHLGHVALIQFALKRCAHLTVAMVVKPEDPISKTMRLSWFERLYGDALTVDVVDLSQVDLPVTQSHTKEAEAVWTEYFIEHYRQIDVLFSSEAYGETLAQTLGIPHVIFDPKRIAVPISGEKIRSNPEAAASYLPEIVYEDMIKK